MQNQIEDITLIKCLGKGSFGEVYLSTKRGRPGYYATKKISRAQADEPSFRKYFENEIKLLKSLNHPNIVKLEDLKGTKDYYYIVMEYINGGSLTDCLKKYQQKTGKSFPEEIVQYLMRQIVDAIKYIHNLKIIHRDLKLDNIMVNFDNEFDKNNVNMMRAKIKIIDFGFAIHLEKSSMAFSALGSPINMDPVILKKFSGKQERGLGYDMKADIWSLGTICYEMLIGQSVFNAETMTELVKKVENGSYSVPTTVSSELVSFLNGMLQYNGELRLSANELSQHPFLTKNVNQFTKINTKKVSKKIDSKGLNINVKKNQTIWAIFNQEDEERLINIRGGRDLPAPEDSQEELGIRKSKTEKIRMPNSQQYYNNPAINRNLNKQNSGMYPNYPNYGTSFYGQSMHASNKTNNAFNQMPGRQMPGMPQMSGMQPMPNMQMPGFQPMVGMPYNNPQMNNFPTFGVPMGYPYGGMYPNNSMGAPQNYPPVNNTMSGNNIPSGYKPYNAKEVDEDGKGCLIQ